MRAWTDTMVTSGGKEVPFFYSCTDLDKGNKWGEVGKICIIIVLGKNELELNALESSLLLRHWPLWLNIFLTYMGHKVAQRMCHTQKYLFHCQGIWVLLQVHIYSQSTSQNDPLNIWHLQLVYWDYGGSRILWVNSGIFKGRGGFSGATRWREVSTMTWSSPRRPLFIHALSFQCTSKLCINFINQVSIYFLI